jgi:hypothetical protein
MPHNICFVDPVRAYAKLLFAFFSLHTVSHTPSWTRSSLSLAGILRIDRKFKSHGPQQLRRAYRKRVAVERVFSRLKNLAGLTQHNLRGLAKITFHAQLCLLIMLFTAQAAINTHRPSRSRSIRYFAS